MRRLGYCLIMVILVGCAWTPAAGADEIPWFDYENCSVCRHFGAYDGLLDHMTTDHYETENGFITVTTVTESHLEAYRAASAKMAATIKGMMTGEEIHLCGSCIALSSAIAKGVRYEPVKTRNGTVSIFTTNDSELLVELRSWVARTQEEPGGPAGTDGGGEPDG